MTAKPAMRARADGAIRGLRAWLRDTNGLVVAVTGSVLAAYLLWLVLTPRGPHRLLIANVANVPLDLAAGISALLTSRARSLNARTRQAWFWCALAFFADGTGNLGWLIQENLLGAVPSPSWADIGYLAFYPLCMYALLRFPRWRRGWEESLKFWLDVGIVMVAGGTVIWYVLLAPALESPSAGVLDTILSFAYPLGDLVLVFGCAVVLMRRSPPESRLPIMLLGAGGLALLLADLLYGWAEMRGNGYHSGTWIDIWFQLSGLLWFSAAQYQRWRTRRPALSIAGRQEASPDVSLLPYVAIPMGYAVLLLVALPHWSRTLAGVVLAVLALTALVVMRQFTAVHENQRLLAERAAREARFRSLVQNSSDVIIVIDGAGVIQFCSPAVTRVFGWDSDALTGKKVFEVGHGDDETLLRNFLRQVSAQEGATASAVWRLRHASGDWRYVETVATCLLADPAVGGIVMNTRDVSERTALEQELTHQVYHDALTGLVNRVRFRAQVERALQQAGEVPASVAVLFLDLDNFKTVNDSLGHAEGDRLLREVATRLLSATRGSDIVARLGGDEFALLLEKVTSDEQAVVVAERIISGLRRPFTLDAAEVNVSASIGIARGREGQGTTELLRNADVAMYVAKRHRTGRYMIFEPEMHSEIRDRMALEADLRHAVERAEFTVEYQPIVNLGTGEIAGAEALVRWQHPTRGAISPVEFIPIAEDSGLIVPLGRIVMTTACRDAARWVAADSRPFSLTVNISGKQLQSSLADDLALALDDSGLPAASLLLEITESVVMRNTESMLAKLHALKGLGVQLAIDDFGTGYSSLAYLQRFPIDVLKIDKTFVDHMGSDDSGGSLSRTVVALGNALGLRTVAEGVERVEQVAALRAIGCDYAQGYYFSVPVRAAEMDALLAANRSRSPAARKLAMSAEAA